MKIWKFLLFAALFSSLFILPASAAEGEATASGAAMQFLKAHTGDIFCILTFLGSLLTARAYHAGLLPKLKIGIGRIEKNLKEGLERVTLDVDKTDAFLADFVEECKPTFTKFEELEGELQALLAEREELCHALDEEKALRARLLLTAEGQTELLYGILLAANLPAYQKDALSEAYLRTKALLAPAGETI